MISIKERELILKWNKDGKTQQDIAELLHCHQSSVSRFLVKYKRKGTVQNLPRGGRPTKLTKQNLTKLKNKICIHLTEANDRYCSVSTKQVKDLISKEIGEIYSLRHVERIMHKIGFSLITPRPQHVRHDQKKVDTFRGEFKKNLNRNMWVMS
jgi:transposase